MGGAKVSDKIKIIENILSEVDQLLIGGAVAYPFLQARVLKLVNRYAPKKMSNWQRYFTAPNWTENYSTKRPHCQ